MINLKKISGFDLKYQNKKLISSKIKLPKPDLRNTKEMKSMFYSSIKKENIIYYMYREILKKNSLRYDITIIPPNIIGKEYVKTKGHYHPKIKGTKFTYPEIYEILQGNAIFLLQKKVNKKITKVVAIKAKKGDKVIMPPNYGHITINPKKTVLIMANIVSTKFKSKYKEYEKKKGGAYYGLVWGEKIKFIKNKNYKQMPKLEKKKAKKHSKIFNNKTLYEIFVKEPEKLEFLNKPWKVSNDNYKF